MNQPKRNRISPTPEDRSPALSRLAKSYIKLRELLQGKVRGQTMTEYALILAAVAVLVFVTYETMGQTINSMVEWQTIDIYLTSS
jgi:Flp pilus assembly pilin Flp